MTTFHAPENFCQYLVGSWKRNLEWRHFGGSFQHLRTSNTIVAIEEYKGIAAPDPGVQYLKWSFGKSLAKNCLRFGYVMKFIPDAQGMFMEWKYADNRCHGMFQPSSSVAILNFFLQSSTVTITYRVMGPDTMAVCIVEVDGRHTPTIQYGNM